MYIFIIKIKNVNIVFLEIISKFRAQGIWKTNNIWSAVQLHHASKWCLKSPCYLHPTWLLPEWKDLEILVMINQTWPVDLNNSLSLSPSTSIKIFILDWEWKEVIQNTNVRTIYDTLFTALIHLYILLKNRKYILFWEIRYCIFILPMPHINN